MTWENFYNYIGVHGLLAVILTLSMIGWVTFSREVPPEAWALLGAAWGFYFAKNGSGRGNGNSK